MRFDHEEWTGRLLGAAHLIKFFQKLFLDACFFSRPEWTTGLNFIISYIFLSMWPGTQVFFPHRPLLWAFLPSCMLSRRIHHTSLLLWQTLPQFWNFGSVFCIKTSWQENSDLMKCHGGTTELLDSACRLSFSSSQPVCPSGRTEPDHLKSFHETESQIDWDKCQLLKTWTVKGFWL